MSVEKHDHNSEPFIPGLEPGPVREGNLAGETGVEKQDQIPVTAGGNKEDSVKEGVQEGDGDNTRPLYGAKELAEKYDDDSPWWEK